MLPTLLNLFGLGPRKLLAVPTKLITVSHIYVKIAVIGE